MLQFRNSRKYFTGQNQTLLRPFNTASYLLHRINSFPPSSNNHSFTFPFISYTSSSALYCQKKITPELCGFPASLVNHSQPTFTTSSGSHIHFMLLEHDIIDSNFVILEQLFLTILIFECVTIEASPQYSLSTKINQMAFNWYERTTISWSHPVCSIRSDSLKRGEPHFQHVKGR